VNDTERVFVFRAFSLARGFDSALPGLDQNVAASGVAEPLSLCSVARTTPAARSGGTTSQPGRRAGDSTLLAERTYTTRSGARRCNAPIGSRSYRYSGVVIVFDDHRAPSLRPFQQGRAALGARTAPVGYWCAGVTSTAPVSTRSRRSTQIPRSSTGMRGVSSPLA